MKTTFKKYITESVDNEKIVQNWLLADLIISEDLESFNRFNDRNLSNTQTPYYDFFMSSHISLSSQESCRILLNYVSIKGDTIQLLANGLLIENYEKINSLEAPASILESKNFTITCFKSTDIMVEQWWPQKIEKRLVINNKTNSKIKVSLTNIHKTVKSCQHIDLPYSNLILEGGVLGLFKIDGLKSVNISIDPPSKVYKTLSKDHPAYDLNLGGIITKCLGEMGMFECQQMLIDAGFEEYAQL